MPELAAWITATQIRDLATCEHRFHLDLNGDATQRDPVGGFVKMLWEGGVRHEADVLRDLQGPNVDLRDVPFEEREAETDRAVAGFAPLILGARIAFGDLVGMPDVMRLDPILGYVGGDVKSGAAFESGAGGRMKKQYGVQIAHYAKILGEKRWGPDGVSFIIGHDRVEHGYDLLAPLGRDGLTMSGLHERMLGRARLIRNGCIRTTPAYSSICAQCHWRTLCRSALEERRDCTLLPQVGRSVRDALGPDLSTIPAIANLDLSAYTGPSGASTIGGVGLERLSRLRDRAVLLDTPNAQPFARRPLDLPIHDHEIHYDVESDPLRAGLVYLHGFFEVIRRGDRIETCYTGFFADAPEAENEVFRQAMDFLGARPEAHIYVWSRFERTSLRALQARYPAACDKEEVERLFRPDRCTDLYTDVVAPHTEWPLTGYGLKKVARHVGFEWRDEDPSGANSIAWFASWLETGDEAVRQRIIRYNEDDVIATARVLVALRYLQVRQ